MPALESSTTSSDGTSTSAPLQGKFWESTFSDTEATSQSESDHGSPGYWTSDQKTSVKEDLDWLSDHSPESEYAAPSKASDTSPAATGNRGQSPHEAPENRNTPATARLSAFLQRGLELIKAKSHLLSGLSTFMLSESCPALVPGATAAKENENLVRVYPHLHGITPPHNVL